MSSNEYWSRFEIWCCLKHFLKAEVNLKETIEKAYRKGDEFIPEGGDLRNFLTAVGNIEATVGHFEEFAMREHGLDGKEHEQKYEFYKEMTDSTRFVRQKAIKCAGAKPDSLVGCLDLLESLMDKLLDFMRGKDITKILEADYEIREE